MTEQTRDILKKMLSLMMRQAGWLHDALAETGDLSRRPLGRRSLGNELVHTVTPKGHSLVFVLGANTISGLPALHARDIDRHLDEGMRLA